MKKIIFLSFAFLCLFLVKIQGNGLYLLIEDLELRPIEELSKTNNLEFNQLLEANKVYTFKKAYPMLYLIENML